MGIRLVLFLRKKNSIILYRPVSEEIKQIIEKDTEKESSEKILSLINDNSAITIEELSTLLRITTRAIEKNLSKLKAKGMLERIGPDKGGYWRVNI